MDSYVVRIYRRDGKKVAFSNIEELWEILRRRKCRDFFSPSSSRRRLRKEVMSETATSDIEKSAEGVRQMKSDFVP